MRIEKEKRDKSFLSVMRTLCIVAFACSILLTAYLIYHSARSGLESSNSSNGVSYKIKEWFGIDDTVIPQKIEFDTSDFNKTYYYSQDDIKLPIKFTPENADTEVTYNFTSDGMPIDGCSVDSDGIFRYTGIEGKNITVTAVSIHDNSVRGSISVYCRGISPDDDCVENVGVKFFDSMAGESLVECDPSGLHVGKEYYVKLVLTIKDEYLDAHRIDKKELYAESLPYHLFSNYNGEDRLCYFDSRTGSITFLKDFNGSLTFKLRKTDKTYFSDISQNEKINPVVNICAKTYQNYTPNVPPALFLDKLLQEGAEVEMPSLNNYIIRVPQNVSSIVLDADKTAATANLMGKLIYMDNESESIADISQRVCLRRRVNRGECNLYWVSLLDESIRVGIKIIFEGYTASDITLFGPKVISVGTAETYSASFLNNLYNEGNITISIIEGTDIASLDDGILTAKKLGRVVLRAQSVYYPDIYEDLEIKVRLWDNFDLTVRKLIGHFLPFFLLGQGYMLTYILMIKKKWVAFISTPISLFAVSALTELIQYYTPGRVGLWSDVFLNLLGGLFGMIFLILSFSVYQLILMKTNRRHYEKLKNTIVDISYKTLFNNKSK